jgi:hypothetical protein
MQVPELQRYYSEWEIIGAAEIRHITEINTRPYNPFRSPAPARAIIAPMLLWIHTWHG